ncbi:Rv3654c family TadE-like protein [Asanoa sp. NPDC050611]|uniref:Rv3654c family TadE-like protein n=1 Tax=Asanoa sp. NPDC050611 TaxID=3157098 RepID=UPI0033CF5B5B
MLIDYLFASLVGRPPAGRRTLTRCRDRGAATVWALAIGLSFVLLGMACAAVGVAAVGRHQAQTAADLGALAGAARALEGPAAVCTRAGEIVAANGGRVSGCVVHGFDVVVTVEVSVRLPPRGTIRIATARARAGPVAAPP